MEQIDAADKQVGDPDEEKVWVFDILLRIPGDHKKGVGDDDAEDLRKTVKEKIVNPAGKI